MTALLLAFALCTPYQCVSPRAPIEHQPGLFFIEHPEQGLGNWIIVDEDGNAVWCQCVIKQEVPR